MTREQAKEYVLQQEPTFLHPAKRISGKQSYVCPVCGNGSGKDGTGITKDPGSKTHPHYSCFRCKTNGRGYYDIVELYAEENGLDIKEPSTFDSIYSYYGLTIDQNDKGATRGDKTPPRVADQEEPQTDYNAYYLQCIKNNDYLYLKARGISEEVQKRFHIGLDREWTHPKAPNAPKSPRCIIPSSKYCYLARDTRADIPEEAKGYAKSKVGHNAPPFNLEALNSDSKAIFITEGEIDALSVEEVGYKAIGLGGASKARSFVAVLKENYKGQAFIILADKDENNTGDIAKAIIEEGLKEINAPYLIGDIKAHDPNEALIQNREAFAEIIKELYAQATSKADAESKNEYSTLDILGHFKNIENEAPGYEVSTGFAILDKELAGGLHEGLYILGAVSSLGKTTFTLNLADQVAKGGNDVIFFSLEMSKYEIMAKSISRLTYYKNGKSRAENGNTLAKDTQHILNGKRYSGYSAEEKEAISNAIAYYEEQIAPHFYIYEGRYNGERLTVNHITQIVNRHIATTGNKPFVIVDYLQILAPLDIRSTDKQATDENVFLLKELSRMFSIPVLAISSFNRENYTAPVGMQSFKESGAVEYSSDILIGLQYKGMDYKKIEYTGKDGTRKVRIESQSERQERLIDEEAKRFEKKKAKEPIQIELKCLKNRNGYQFTVEFDMVNAYNYFEEHEEGFKPVYGYTTPFDEIRNKIKAN